jgi:two-component system sensor histidine kinase UhpB
VFRAASFAEGLQKANELAVDVGLFDQNLGDGTGLELLGALRSMGSDIPVILLTGMDSSALDAAALRAGAADYLPKADLTPWLLERSIRYAREQAATLSELRKTNRLLDAMVTRLPVAVVRIDSDGTVLESRGRGWESLGFRPAKWSAGVCRRKCPTVRPDSTTRWRGRRCLSRAPCNGAERGITLIITFSSTRNEDAVRLASRSM